MSEDDHPEGAITSEDLPFPRDEPIEESSPVVRRKPHITVLPEGSNNDAR